MKECCRNCTYAASLDKNRELWLCTYLDVQFGRVLADNCFCGKFEVKEDEADRVHS